MKTIEQRLEAIERNLCEVNEILRHKPGGNPVLERQEADVEPKQTSRYIKVGADTIKHVENLWPGDALTAYGGPIPEIKRDWEVLEFRDSETGFRYSLRVDGKYNGIHSLECMLHENPCVDSGHIFIHSVRRTTDGQVFTVGDKLISSTIDRFEVVKGDMWIHGLNWMQKLGEVKIFTTADGVPISEGRRVYEVVGNAIFMTTFKIGKTYSGDLYSTHEAAEPHTRYTTKDGIAVKGFRSIMYGWNKYGTFTTSMAQKMDPNADYYSTRIAAYTAYNNWLQSQRMLSLGDVLGCDGDIAKLEEIVKSRLV